MCFLYSKSSVLCILGTKSSSVNSIVDVISMVSLSSLRSVVPKMFRFDAGFSENKTAQFHKWLAVS